MPLRTEVAWPEDRVLRMVSLWNRGVTPRTIAAEFGITQQALEIKVRDLQLPDQPSFRLVAEAIRADERHDDGCSWPIEKNGEFDHFCCEKTRAGKPYCAAHSNRAYLKRAPHSEGVSARP